MAGIFHRYFFFFFLTLMFTNVVPGANLLFFFLSFIYFQIDWDTFRTTARIFCPHQGDLCSLFFLVTTVTRTKSNGQFKTTFVTGTGGEGNTSNGGNSSDYTCLKGNFSVLCRQFLLFPLEYPKRPMKETSPVGHMRRM